MTRKKIVAILMLMLSISFTNLSSNPVEDTLTETIENNDVLTRHSRNLSIKKEEIILKTVTLPKEITRGEIIIPEKPKEEWYDIEVSFYSDLQDTDYGDGSVDCMGKPLYEGCFAFNGLPVNTRFKIKWEDGRIEEGVIRDRTANWVYQKHPNRFDKFVSGVSEKQLYSIGLKKAKIMILKD